MYILPVHKNTLGSLCSLISNADPRGARPIARDGSAPFTTRWYFSVFSVLSRVLVMGRVQHNAAPASRKSRERAFHRCREQLAAALRQLFTIYRAVACVPASAPLP